MDISTRSLNRQNIGLVQPWDHAADSSSNFTSSSEDSQDARAAPANVLHILAFVLILCFVICIALAMRDGISRCCGSDRQRGEQGDAVNAQGSKQEGALETQRQQRRLWYSYYLQPFQTVLTADHFMTHNDNEKRVATEDQTQMDTNSSGSRGLHQPAHISIDVDDPQNEGLTCETKTEEEVKAEIEEPDTKAEHNQACQPVRVGSQVKMMTLWDSRSSTFRQMEANCSICLIDYEEGDTIVRSAATEEQEVCIHVFHFDCMLQWLSQGKKRCPFCRHWFVPSVPIKEQMKQAHVVTKDSLHHLYDARTLQNLLTGDTDSKMSQSVSIDAEAGSDRGGACDPELGSPVSQVAASAQEHEA